MKFKKTPCGSCNKKQSLAAGKLLVNQHKAKAGVKPKKAKITYL